jgi:hypothetical protein
MDQHTMETDILIAGGGMAGTCAAVAAARQGAKVVLVQDRSVLGGNASSDVRMHIVGADCHGSRKGTRESGLIEEFRLEDAVRNPTRCFPYWDILLYEKVISEPNITLLLDTDVMGVELEKGALPRNEDRPQRTARMYEFLGKPARIKSARAVRNITEDEFIIRAKYYADCTGDGRLGFEAGADFRIGRESKSMHGESLAIDQDDTQTLGSTILLTTRKTDKPQPFIAPTWARKFGPEAFAHGRSIGSWEYGFWWVEWGGHLNTLKDHTTIIRHELYRIALGLWDYVKNSGKFPASANWVLDWIGANPGKRESRRFLGPHILTQQDLQTSRKFDDEVAYGGWAIDIHPPRGMDQLDQPPFTPTHLPKTYGIPLRSYFSRNVENLFFAGRDISASHVAFASTRVMATCSVGGEAVGFAAAYCARNGIDPAALVSSPSHLHNLQQAMLSEDVTLLNIPFDSERNKAHFANVSASSAQPTFSAENTVDGHTRDEMDQKSGAVTTPHSWRSNPLADDFPAWIEYEWRQPQTLSRIDVWFDTGFQRQLTLSASDSTTASVIRGPQPECAREYLLEVDGQKIALEKENHQRKRTHILPSPIKASKLRLTVMATHGAPEARVVEFRAS